MLELQALDLCPWITSLIQDLNKVQKWLNCRLDLPENTEVTGTICHKRKSTHFQSFYWNDCFTQISDFPLKDIKLARDSWFKLRLFYLNDICGFYSRKREILNLTCNLELVFSMLVGNKWWMNTKTWKKSWNVLWCDCHEILAFNILT